MKYYFLGSGSGGNSTALVNDNNDILLIDCGLSINEIKKRMDECNLDFNNIKKVLITHTHIDHIKSVRAFDANVVYINEECQMNEFNTFRYYENFDLLGFNIYTLPASHDAPGTTGFLIEYNGEKMAYLTDTGYIHENIQRIINNCNIFCVESNHDPRLLMLTKRPIFLKNRILSANGHLSNQDCAYALGNMIGPKTKEIIFLHRSQEANTEEMIKETFKKIMSQMNINIETLNVKIAKQDSPVSYLDEPIKF